MVRSRRTTGSETTATAARTARRGRAAAAIVAAALAGCSVRQLATDKLGDALAAPGTVWGGDTDVQLVGDALPFALKMHETLLAESPDHEALLVATCRGFTSYAAGWVEPEAERLEASDFEAAQTVRARALELYLRARGYCLRALELRLPGAAAALRTATGTASDTALAAARASDVELLYWSGAAWGSAVSLGLERPELVADLPAVRALFARALALDADFDRGAIHEAMISIESVSELLGGSAERARSHYERAVELSEGRRAGPHVTYARSALVGAQDRRGFRIALERALAIDPNASEADRLANRLAQQRARRLLGRADELFFEDEAEDEAAGEVNEKEGGGTTP